MNTLSVRNKEVIYWDRLDEWLSVILADALDLESVKVLRTECKPLSGISGFLSQVFVLKLEYEVDDPELPKSIILKTTHPKSYNKELSKQLKAFQGEIRFYNDIANRTDLNVPRCFYSHINEKTGEGFLLLEDMSSIDGGDQVSGMSFQDTKAVIDQIGKLHAQFWNSPDLFDFEDLPENEYVFAHDFRLGWDTFKRDRGYKLSKYQLEVGDLLQKKMQAVLFVARHRPQSLIHSDLRADNLRYQPGAKETMTILDWQLASVGIPAFDFVRLVCGSRTNNKRDIERLAYSWLKSLRAGGVRNYSIKECIFDLRLALLLALHIPIVIHHRMIKEGMNNDSRLLNLADVMADRFFECAEGLKVMKVLSRV